MCVRERCVWCERERRERERRVCVVCVRERRVCESVCECERVSVRERRVVCV